MKKMMLKKQTRSLQKLFLALLGLGATANTYAVQSDDETAASDTDFQEPACRYDANWQLQVAAWQGNLQKIEYLTHPSRTHKPTKSGINQSIANGLCIGRNELAKYLAKYSPPDEKGCKTILERVFLYKDGDVSEPYDFLFNDKSIIHLDPSTENQIWALNNLFKYKSENKGKCEFDLAKLHSFSVEALKGSIALGKYLDANPLSDEKFYEIMMIRRTKDGHNVPFGGPNAPFGEYLAPFSEYLMYRYNLRGPKAYHYFSPEFSPEAKRDFSQKAMDKVVKRLLDNGRFGMDKLAIFVTKTSMPESDLDKRYKEQINKHYGWNVLY